MGPTGEDLESSPFAGSVFKPRLHSEEEVHLSELRKETTVMSEAHLIREPQLQPSDLLTTAEAAVYLRISEWTLRHWVSDRKIKFFKVGNRVRFRRAHLDRFLAGNLHGKEQQHD